MRSRLTRALALAARHGAAWRRHTLGPVGWTRGFINTSARGGVSVRAFRAVGGNPEAANAVHVLTAYELDRTPPLLVTPMRLEPKGASGGGGGGGGGWSGGGGGAAGLGAKLWKDVRLLREVRAGNPSGRALH
jgi:hypothetical protein